MDKNYTMSKNVLLTGAAGFLGSHIAMHHLQMGDKVLGIDNFSSSKNDSKHVKALIAKGLKLYEGDISKEDDLWLGYSEFRDEYSEVKFDLIYNCACPASPPIYQSIPIETMMTCTLGVKNILDIARAHKCIMVHASTSEVYGDPLTSPQREIDRGNVNSFGVRSCYDEGKRAAEALCHDYLHKYDVDVRLVRIFNTYGPQMQADDGRVVSNFICQALRGEKITIYGDGKQTRSFCYVDDLIRGIISMGEIANNPMHPINLGNPHEFTINELANFVQKMIGKQRIVYLDLPKDDPTRRCPDITSAITTLGWSPYISLDKGLERTIDYFKSVI